MIRAGARRSGRDSIRDPRAPARVAPQPEIMITGRLVETVPGLPAECNSDTTDSEYATMILPGPARTLRASDFTS